MNKGKHHHKGVYTFMMIPNDDTEIKTFKFPKWFLKTTSISLICILVASSLFIFSFIGLRNRYANQSKDIEGLKEVNDKQRKQIDELQSYANNISEKIDSLNKLESQVKDLVGLEDGDEYDDEEIIKGSTYTPYVIGDNDVASRGGLFNFRDNSLKDYDQRGTLEGIKEDLNRMKGELSKEESNFTNLKGDVAEQLNYLAAVPSGWPSGGRITSPFGKRRAPRWGASTFHKGVDIANGHGANVRTAADGKVISAGWKGGMGRTVVVSHGYGFTTVYGHNSSILVELGQEVERGQVIAKMGNTGNSTGPHVHFEIHENGSHVDPMKYLGK